MTSQVERSFTWALDRWMPGVPFSLKLPFSLKPWFSNHVFRKSVFLNQAFLSSFPPQRRLTAFLFAQAAAR
jgi:hypothetical protein